MLSLYYSNLFRIGQLRVGLAKPFIDGFANELRKNHYGTLTARGHLRAAVHLGVYLQVKKVDFDQIDEEVFESFVGHLPKCNCPCIGLGSGQVVAGVKLFLEYLRSTVFPDLWDPKKKKQHEPELVRSFIYWLEHQLGLSESSRRIYGQAATKLINALGQDPAAYHAKNLRSFLFDQTKMISSGSVPGFLHGIRKFIRYLTHIDACAFGLEYAIPAVASWPSSSLPSYLSSSELNRLIHACESTSLMGVRDRAVILLLSRLGLRAGDVASLSLSKIDWSDGSFLVSGKDGKEVRFPLTQEIGDTLIEYLKLCPRRGHDSVFLRMLAPFTPLPSGAISQIVTRRMRKAKIHSPRYGAHILRHTAATQMLREGRSLYEIGKVLRHQSVDTTAIYAKVDMKTLEHVAIPWPEVL